MDETKPKPRTPVYLILIIAGVFILGAAAFPLLLNARGQALQSAEPVVPPAKLSQPAPALTLADLSGSQVSLADYHGRFVLVNNWATWCPPCVAEMPELEAYYSAHAAQGFILVAIESGEPAKTVAAFVQKYQLTFQVLLDPPGKALEAFNNWSLPSSYLIDPSGTIQLAWAGPVTRAALEKYVTPFLEK